MKRAATLADKAAHPLRILGKGLLCLLLVPYLLVPVYAFVPPVSMHMLGSLLAGEGMQRQWVPLERMHPSIVHAVLASEDNRFCDHHGIDFDAIDAAMQKARRTGRTLHGASTISAQTAKNLFLWNDRSWLRKSLEIPLTLWLDAVLSKRRILEIYLNVAEWGPGLFGIEAASQAYFQRPAERLAPAQAALLATALPFPRRAPGPSGSLPPSSGATHRGPHAPGAGLGSLRFAAGAVIHAGSTGREQPGRLGAVGLFA